MISNFDITDEYNEPSWNERLGVTQMPPADMSQGQPQTSSLPPESSQAPTIDYDASAGQSDMFGSGVSGQDQLIAPKAPVTTPASVPARSKTAATATPEGAFELANHLLNVHGWSSDKIRDHDQNVEHHNAWHSDDHLVNGTDHRHSSKEAAISTLYGDVEPTPTTGESGNDGSQANRNNSSDNLPNGPDSAPAKGLAEGEEGGAGLAADVGEVASIAAFASKHWIPSALDPKEAKFKYIRHNSKTGKWEIFQKGTGKTLSTHDSEKQAEKAFSAMEANMHG
jgi:hypothetical protein